MSLFPKAPGQPMPEAVHALVCSWYAETPVPKVARYRNTAHGIMGIDDLEALIKDVKRLALAARTPNLLLTRWFLMKATAAHQAGMAYIFGDQVEEICTRNRVMARMLETLPRRMLTSLEIRFGRTMVGLDMGRLEEEEN